MAKDMTMGTIKTVIIEDEKLVVSLLERGLRQIPEISIAGSSYTGKDALTTCLKLKPDLVLLDLELPEISGLDVARQLRARLPGTWIIVVSSHYEPFTIHELDRLSIHGFVDKGSSFDALLNIIRSVIAGNTAYCPVYTAVRQELQRQAEAYQKLLTPREISVLIAVAEGLNDLALAERFDITPNTAATHRRNIRQKLNAHNDRDLLNYARQWGLISLARSDGNLTHPHKA